MKITIEFKGKAYDFDTNERKSYRIVSKLEGFKDELIHEISYDGSNFKISLLTHGLRTFSSTNPSGQVCPKCNGSGKI